MLGHIVPFVGHPRVPPCLSPSGSPPAWRIFPARASSLLHTSPVRMSDDGVSFGRCFFLVKARNTYMWKENSRKGLSSSPARLGLGNPSTIQPVTGQGVTYPTHALVYYRRAANRKAFSKYEIIYKLRSKCGPAKGKACKDKWLLVCGATLHANVSLAFSSAATALNLNVSYKLVSQVKLLAWRHLPAVLSPGTPEKLLHFAGQDCNLWRHHIMLTARKPCPELKSHFLPPSVLCTRIFYLPAFLRGTRTNGLTVCFAKLISGASRTEKASSITGHVATKAIQMSSCVFVRRRQKHNQSFKAQSLFCEDNNTSKYWIMSYTQVLFWTAGWWISFLVKMSRWFMWRGGSLHCGGEFASDISLCFMWHDYYTISAGGSDHRVIYGNPGRLICVRGKRERWNEEKPFECKKLGRRI